MGACDFWTEIKGESAKDAFAKVVDHARFMHGHGGYTGTIAEKDSFVMVTPTMAELEDAKKKVLDSINSKLKRFEDACKSSEKVIKIQSGNCTSYLEVAECKIQIDKLKKILADESMIQLEAKRRWGRELLNSDDRRISDKWGPAGCLLLAEGHYAFFGFASS